MNCATVCLLILGLLPNPGQNHVSNPGHSQGRHGQAGALLPFSSVNVALLSQIDLTGFAASSGNDIWGYVSPAGREYALMGLNNKVAFVEVTDPSNPNYFANVPHTSSTWADIKVYRDYAYVVTEASGAGIQVIDLTDIDNHNVTLVRTIAEPNKSHNLAVDPDSGFLYTCGSHDGALSGVTACFDLTDPSNPVRTGQTSMTSAYQHDMAPVTFASGPYAGKQFLFGNGEGRGVEIWDVTDKNAPVLFGKATYPNVGYNHQGWLSADRHYWYVDDELDELDFGIPTRTLVFDVSDIANPTLVNTFSTGLQTIDHNLYLKGGFIFESDYTSGLRIFDTNDDPVNPTSVGWFDTYPNDDSTTFNGTWSNYPFFPSGTVVVSDINRGLFVLDVSDATVRVAGSPSYSVFRGVQQSGGLGSLSDVDGDYLVVKAGPTLFAGEAPVQVVFEGTLLWSNVSKLRLRMSGKANTPGLLRTVEIFDWKTSTWVQAEQVAVGTSTLTNEVTIPDPDRFIEPGTNKVRARMRLAQTSPVLLWPWSYSIDQFVFAANP